MPDWIEEKQKTKLPLIVIYDHPSDFPNHYVARLWNWNQPTNVYDTADTIEELQVKLPLDGMVWIDRHPLEDRAILGTWV